MSMDFSLMEDIIRRLGQIECRLDQIETREGVRISVSTANVSSPPTDAELDAAFGQPATLGSGFQGGIDDNNLGIIFWDVEVINGSWTYVSRTLAV